MKKKYFEEAFTNSVLVKQKCIKLGFNSLYKIANIIVSSIKNGGKLMICGNGGSAADAQHLVAELLVRLKSNVNREPIPAITLAQDTSTITACGNDYSFDEIYSRNLQALGNENDCLLVISTSGKSINIINAMNTAIKKKISVCAFLGNDGGDCLKLSDQSFIVPSELTSTIQECHITAGHALMEIIEDQIIEN